MKMERVLQLGLLHMDAGLGWWQGRIRTDQDVPKIRGDAGKLT